MALSSLFTAKIKPLRSSSSPSSSSPASRCDFAQAQNCLQTLLKGGYTPTLSSLNDHLILLFKHHKFRLILSLFSQIKSNHIDCDSRSLSIFLSSFIKLHQFEEVHCFMKSEMEKTANFLNCLWDRLIRSFSSIHKDPDKALLVLRDCLENYNHGGFFSSFTFVSLVRSFTSQGKMSNAVEVLELMNADSIRYPFGYFVCSEVISGFCEIGKPGIAIEFVKGTERCGVFRPDVVTYMLFVRALCKLGRTKEINFLASRMVKEGVVFAVFFYSNWISGYTGEGVLDRAFSGYRETVESGRVPPAFIDYTTVPIDGFSTELNMEKAVKLLGEMRKNGFESNLNTFILIMLGLCKEGKLHEALKVFDLVGNVGLNANEFIYSALIEVAYMRGYFYCVFYLLDVMEKKGIKPSTVTYNTIIYGLCNVLRTSKAKDVSKDRVEDSFPKDRDEIMGYTGEEGVGILKIMWRLREALCLDVVICNILIKVLFMVGAFDYAYLVYKEMPEVDIVADSVTYILMIGGYFKIGRSDAALEIFDQFKESTVFMVECYNCMVHQLCRMNMIDMAVEMVNEVKEKGLSLDLGTYIKLMETIFEKQNGKGVLSLIQNLENLGLRLYIAICNSAICFLCKRGSLESAFNVYMVMRRKCYVVSSKSYYLIIKGLIDEEKEWLYLPFINIFVKKYGLVERRVNKLLAYYLCKKDIKTAVSFVDKITCTSTITIPETVVKKLVEDSRPLDAYKLITEAEDSLPYLDVVDYTIVVDGLCKEGHLDKALYLCSFLEKKGFAPNIVTYNSVINGLCRQGCVFEAFRLFDALERIKLVPSEITFATLISHLCKEGFFLDAKQLFERMVLKGLKPDTRIFNSFVFGYCKFNKVEEALKLLLDMEISCFKPDAFTVSAVIYGFFNRGDMEGAFEFFYKYKSKGTLPDFLGFLFLIRGLCSNGRIEEARTILREMFQAQSVMGLINKVDEEIETESTGNFLVHLCEQGRIKEAITVLNVVASSLFPSKGSSCVSDSLKFEKLNATGKSSSGTSQLLDSIPEANLFGRSTSVEEREKADGKHKDSNGHQLHDFEAYYSLVTSFCSRGELWEANRLVKDMLCRFHSGS